MAARTSRRTVPLTGERLLGGCDAEQRAAITSLEQPLCILAPAGSGKTRVLTRRIAWRVLEGHALAGHVLTLTFTRKAASELRSRLTSLGLPSGVTAGTFHAIALSELRRLAVERREPPPVILASKARLLHAVLSTRHSRNANPDHVLVHELAAEIEWAKSRLVPPSTYEVSARLARRRPRMQLSEVAEVYEGYERERRRRRVLDFEDLLTTCAAELVEDVEFAASARWRYRHLFVDEYQDVNEAQLRLLKTWAGAGDDLCVVGDPDQAIYAWNGSDPEAIHRFAKDFPGARVLELRTNYRSTGEVLRVASAVLRRDTVPPAGGPVPEGPIPSLVAYDSDEDEAAGVAALARRSHRPGRSWSSIAVLARTNAQLIVVRQAFEAAGIPARIVGEPGFTRKPHLSGVLTSLCGARDRNALAIALADLRAGDEEGGVACSAEVMADREALGSLVEDYLTGDAAPSGAGLKAFLDTAQRGEDAGGSRDAVELLTFHRAKGLEWPTVFVTGLEDGLVPIAHARDDEALAEERRLLYVACTRAEEELHCSWARTRRFGGERVSSRDPSPYLAPIERARQHMVALSRPSREVAQRALAESRKALAGEL